MRRITPTQQQLYDKLKSVDSNLIFHWDDERETK